MQSVAMSKQYNLNAINDRYVMACYSYLIIYKC